MKNDGTNTTRQAKDVVRTLKRLYPDAPCALVHDSPFQLLIATILSAQTTDERVNMVTGPLFKRYPTPEKLARAQQKTAEQILQSIGFFRAKAKNIRTCAKQLVTEFGSQVPQTVEELITLAGVGRKTANVVLGTAFGIPSGVVVDTHVMRLSNRLGLTVEKDPVKIERDLMRQLAKREWIMFSHRMIHHGRAICNARKPLCDDCEMKPFCPKRGVPVPKQR